MNQMEQVKLKMKVGIEEMKAEEQRKDRRGEIQEDRI